MSKKMQKFKAEMINEICNFCKIWMQPSDIHQLMKSDILKLECIAGSKIIAYECLNNYYYINFNIKTFNLN